MIRTLVVEDSNRVEREIKVGWKHDSASEQKKADHLTHDINQDAEGIIDELKAEGYNYNLIGELVE